MLLSAQERAVLERRTLRTASAQALRARIVLACAGPEVPPIVSVAASLQVAPDTVRKWRRRFIAARLDGLADTPLPSRPTALDVDQAEAAVVTAPDSTSSDLADLREARRRIARLQAELAIHRRAAELLGGAAFPADGPQSSG
ncbi:helix-turn-helix domain-containing protein [Streptomyces sp. NPDC005281]|uniref:helix-turn-helix domain-containing protein n=1 Tax=Streptomyces sp. NPDC005281 TaxID=3155712 RepID=UPI0033B92A38